MSVQSRPVTLPGPGTSESFGVSATSAATPAITASSTANFTVPPLSAATIAATPASAIAVAGAPITISLSISGLGNQTTSVALSAATDPNLDVAGLTPISVDPGQTITETLTITSNANAPLNTQLNVIITGTSGTSQTASVQIPVTLQATQALTSETAAAAALAAGRSDLGSTLSGLGSAITSLVASCTPNSLLAVQNYAAILETQAAGNNSFFQVAFLVNGNAFNDIASATCATYTQALNELTQFAADLNALLTAPAAFPFQFAITPVSVVAQPNSTSTFKLQLRNQSRVTQTYNLAVSGIPAGLGDLNTGSITLAPQQAVPAGLPSDPAVVISQTGNTLQSFSFTVFATPSNLPGGAQTASATVNLRPDVLDVEAVTAVPGFVNAGGSVDVQARIANAVNQPTPVKATLQVLSGSNQVIATAGPVQTVLSVADLTATLDFGQVTIPLGTLNGSYKLSAVITDQSGDPLTGGTGTGFLLVGSPVTANLTVSPTTVPTGTSTVLNTLTVIPTGGSGSSLTLVGSVNTASSAQTVAINGNTAYVCDQNEVSVVDITNPAAPTVLTTALSSFIANAANIHCNIQQGDLVIFSDTSSTTIGNNPGFLVFGLSNPQSPNLLNAVPFNKRFVGDPILYLGNTAFLYTNAVTTQFGFETGAFGDIIAVDVSNIGNPQILGTLSVNGDPVYGGPNGFFGEALYNSSILYGAGTTLAGVNTSGGAAALDVIDISNPANPTLSNRVTTSNGLQYLSAPLIQGNTLVALANTGGTPNPESVVVYDISNPANPVIVSTTLTGTFCCAGNGSVVLGPNEFLFAGTQTTSDNTAKPVLLLVNTLNPAAPVITPLSIPVATDDLVIKGNYLYVPTATGLSIYSIPGTALSSVITGYTATVQTANSGVAAYVPTSFNVAPTKITAGSGFDTLQWVNPPVSTLTWNSTITGIQAGQIATVDQGGTVSFTSTLGNGTVNLGQVDVGSDQIVGLSPSTQTLGQGYFGSYPGAQYTIILRNPTAAPVTYNLTIAGIQQSWLPAFPAPMFPASAMVPAQGTATVTLNLSPPLTLASGTYPFEVIASAAGISGSVGGILILNNGNPQQPVAPGPGPVVTYSASDLSLQAIPATVTTGPGGTAIFQVQMTNVGPSTDTFTVGSFGNPAVGVARGAFANQTPTIVPGQTFTDALAVQVPANAPTGPFTQTVFASGSNFGGSSRTQVTINVANSGVALSLTPTPVGVSPGTPAQLTVTHTGAAAATFNLSSAGPAASLITLPLASVTLAAGANQVLNVGIGSPAFATSGFLPFSIAAQSTTQATAAASVSGTIYVQPSLGVTAAFQPPSQAVPASGAAVFPLTVGNSGSVEDGYTAKITGVTGQVTAMLTNIDGTQTSSIPDFQVPGQSLAQLNLNVTPMGTQGGAVMVTITSLTDPTVTVTATATLTTAIVPVVQPPNASALTGLTVPANRLALLNASASTDPNAPPLPLTFAWTLLTKPAGSALTNSSIGFPTAAVATFRPDVVGSYTFNVAVSNGTASANASATYQAADLPPVAVVNQPFNVGTGTFAFLDGVRSYDPDGQSITFAWTLLSAPMGTMVTTNSINNAQTPRPFFTPDLAGAYKLQLIVTDATASSAPVNVTVTAFSGTIPPNANTGSDRNAGVGTLTALSGAMSSDPNPAPLALSYQWTFAAKPMGSALTNASISGAASSTASFTPDVAGDFTLNLVVSNANGTSQTAAVTVHVFSGNIPPNADAGANQFTTPNGTVTLSSAASVDPDTGPLPLAYLWGLDALPTASAATLVHPLTATPQFGADQSGYYIARVEATDGLASGFANTLVTSAAVCDADANGTLNAIDIALIQAALGLTALPDDPRDFDRSGTITGADVTGCSNLLPQGQPAMLQVSPGSFTVNAVQGGAASVQAIQISSTGSALTFTVSSTQPWLTVNVASGSTASLSSVNAKVDPAGLQPGNYMGVLSLIPGTGTTQTVTVTLIVSAPVVVPQNPGGTLLTVPTSLQFSVAGCTSSAPAQTFALSSTVAVSGYNAQSSAAWLNVSPLSGSVPATLTVTVNAAGLAAGSYSAIITFTAPGDSTVLFPVTLTVGAVNPLVVQPLALSLSAASGGVSTPQNLAVGGACGAVSYTAQVDQPWLSLSASSGQTPAQLAVTANAATLPEGSYTGSVIVKSPNAPNSPVTVPLTFTVGAVPPGTSVTYAAVNSASFSVGPIAPGSLFSIFGENFTSTMASATSFPLPTQLGSVSVTMNSIALPLLYVSPSQINSQAPFELSPGPVQLTVTANGMVLSPITVQIAATSPGVFLFLNGSGHAAVENQDYSFNSTQKPAKPGAYLFAFITGQGLVSPAVADGAPAPLTPFSYATAPITATIGGQPAFVSFAGLAPTLAGVSQLNILVPNLPPGDYPLVVISGGVLSNSATVSIGQ